MVVAAGNEGRNNSAGTNGYGTMTARATTRLSLPSGP